MSSESVKAYYGQTLGSSEDLITDACCDLSDIPASIRQAISNTHEDVRKRYYGCGLAVPDLLEGCRVLDLGCGAGRDVYVLSQLVGPEGSVVGIDMTPEQLDIAHSTQAWHARTFGFDNVSFLEGELERLDTLDLEPASFDIIVSNCVINLCTDKAAVLKSAHHLLKSGGEMYFADVYADRRQDPDLARDPVLHGECLSGALYWNDFLNLAQQSGFTDPRLVEDRPLTVQSEEVQAKLGETRFYSATYRLFKTPGLECSCEDYGQAVIYKGDLEEAGKMFRLDKDHHMETGSVSAVCGNTWRMLKSSRFAPHFEFIGDFSNHYGIFKECGRVLPFDDTAFNSPPSRPSDSSGCC